MKKLQFQCATVNGRLGDKAFNNYSHIGYRYSHELQNSYAPDPDPEMTIELYERSYDQNEDLGLNDMKTENYETLPSGKPLAFRPSSTRRKGCCAKAQLLMDIGRSGRHLITNADSSCQSSPAMIRNKHLRPDADVITVQSETPADVGSKQWQLVSRLLLFAFLIIFMAAWSYMLCSMDNDCRPFSSDPRTANSSKFFWWAARDKSLQFGMLDFCNRPTTYCIDCCASSLLRVIFCL